MNKKELIETYTFLKGKRLSSNLINYKSNLYLKLECNLSCGSYKIRGVESFFRKNSFSCFEVLSAGNLALASAKKAEELGVSCIAVVPMSISEIKEKKLKELNSSFRKLKYEHIWSMAKDISLIKKKEFLHPLKEDLILGYGTIIPEIITQMNDVGAIVIPYGLGGLALGITRAIKALSLNIDVYLCELANFSPFNRMKNTSKYSSGSTYSGFIEAMGTPEIIPSVYEELRLSIKDVIIVSEKEVSEGIKKLYQSQKIVVEGAAGACFVAGEKLKKVREDKIVSILTGKNISESIHREILK